MRVLLVDDNEELRDFLALSLTEATVDVVTALDPEDAVRKAEAERFDGIIIDFVMDNGDGVALTLAIPREALQGLAGTVADITRGRARWQVQDPPAP